MSDEWVQASGYVGQQPTAFHLAATAAAEPSSLDRQTLVYRRRRRARDSVRTRLPGCIACKPLGPQLELVCKVDATGKVREERPARANLSQPALAVYRFSFSRCLTTKRDVFIVVELRF